jgi:hypothetical protein
VLAAAACVDAEIKAAGGLVAADQREAQVQLAAGRMPDLPDILAGTSVLASVAASLAAACADAELPPPAHGGPASAGPAGGATPRSTLSSQSILQLAQSGDPNTAALRAAQRPAPQLARDWKVVQTDADAALVRLSEPQGVPARPAGWGLRLRTGLWRARIGWPSTRLRLS